MNDLGPHQSTLDRPGILRALGALSDELGRPGFKGELPSAAAVLDLVEGLFEEGRS